MKRKLAAATVVAFSSVLLSAALPAQTQVTPVPAKAPVAAPAAAPAKAASRGKRRGWTWADARVCLEFPTNMQVIKCSEKYRYKKVPA
jgi:hypothetical protein